METLPPVPCRGRAPPLRALIRELIETAILALLIFLGLQFSVQNFRVEGSSMEPTLHQGQYLLVNKLVYFNLAPHDIRRLVPFVDVDRDESLFAFRPPRRGEVIIFHFPRDRSRDFVKRVIGLPGDVVEMRSGTVYVDGERMEEPYITHPSNASLSPVKVPADSYFVLGDNRRASNDSRDWGPVPAEDIVGRAWVSYWPFGQFGVLRAFALP